MGVEKLIFTTSPPSCSRNEPPLPVAEMVTSDQSAGNIRTFIERFRRDESRLYNGHMSGPRQINADYSRAILLAVLKEFNNETMVNFLARAFRIVNRRGLETDFKLTIPHRRCFNLLNKSKTNRNVTSGVPTIVRAN